MHAPKSAQELMPKFCKYNFASITNRRKLAIHEKSVPRNSGIDKKNQQQTFFWNAYCYHSDALDVRLSFVTQS
jgi:hypothetical protein